MAARGTRRWASVVGAFVALLTLLVPELAWAQTCPNVSISVNSVVNRYVGTTDTANNLFPLRPQNLQPTWINYNDCKSDIRLQFTILVSGLPCSDTIQVWAGPTDCTQVAARQTTSGSTRCWPVAATGSFAMQQSSTGDIRAQDIVAFIDTAEPPTLYSPQGPKGCQAQLSPGGSSLGIYFMAMEADGQTVDGTAAVYGSSGTSSSGGCSSFGADLIGPYPPSNVTAGIGEDLIIVNWTPAVDSTIQGFNIYCEDKGMVNADTGTLLPEASLICPDSGVTQTIPEADIVDGLIVDTGAATMTDAAGCRFVNVDDAGGQGGASCTSNVLVDQFVVGASAVASIDGGFTPIATEASAEAAPTGAVGISNIPNKYLCGQLGGVNSASYTVQNFADGGPAIKDGVEYAVTVAAFDGTGNTGIIGNISCVVPSPVIDFWTAYTNAGGLAGGGFCALEGAGMPVGGSLFGICMGVIGLTMVRRRWRRR
jgi:hypothetical protein